MTDASAELHTDVEALKTAVADAGTRVANEVALLDAQIAAGSTIAAGDLQGIKDATAALTGLAAPPAPPADPPASA